MMNCMSSNFMNVINLGNSIIGVSILAMPYCFQKCGILLSILLIIVSGILVRIACYLLLKGSIMARRRNFEYLAFHAFGSSGKLAVEIGVIGFLIGVCIAFFVVIGDLGPPLASQYLMTKNSPNLRVVVLVLLGFFVALPLGLLRKVDSLTSLSAMSIAFYGCLVLKIFLEASSQLSLNEWWHRVNWWQPAGFLPCLPIFSMALSCQTQLFEFFDTLSEPSLKRMMSVVSGAVYLCSSVYILVGLFGYIACHDKVITGNILVNLTPAIMTEFIKLGFVFTLVISFPLCLFPCRTSLHSLLFKQGLGHHDIATNFIPDHRFRLLTISLVIITIGIAIMIPNIEFVLGIIGSTIGTTICFIFPAVIFLHDISKNTTERRLAQVVMFVGMFILLACTYSTLKEGTETRREVGRSSPQHVQQQVAVELSSLSKPVADVSLDLPKEVKIKKLEAVPNENVALKKLELKDEANEKRQEPPVPHESEVKVIKVSQNTDLDPQALQKEDKEIQKEILQNPSSPSNNAEALLKEKQEQILQKLEEQQKEQKIIIEQQKKVLEELKLHREIHDEVSREKNINLDPKKNTISQKKAVLNGDTKVVEQAIPREEAPVPNVDKFKIIGNINSEKIAKPGLKLAEIQSYKTNASSVLGNINSKKEDVKVDDFLLKKSIPERKVNVDISNISISGEKHVDKMLQQVQVVLNNKIVPSNLPDSKQFNGVQQRKNNFEHKSDSVAILRPTPLVEKVIDSKFGNKIAQSAPQEQNNQSGFQNKVPLSEDEKHEM